MGLLEDAARQAELIADFKQRLCESGKAFDTWKHFWILGMLGHLEEINEILEKVCLDGGR